MYGAIAFDSAIMDGLGELVSGSWEATKQYVAEE